MPRTCQHGGWLLKRSEELGTCCYSLCIVRSQERIRRFLDAAPRRRTFSVKKSTRHSIQSSVMATKPSSLEEPWRRQACASLELQFFLAILSFVSFYVPIHQSMVRQISEAIPQFSWIGVRGVSLKAGAWTCGREADFQTFFSDRYPKSRLVLYSAFATVDRHPLSASDGRAACSSGVTAAISTGIVHPLPPFTPLLHG